MSDVVETLLNLTVGEEVALEAKYYEFASAYEVEDIDEMTFACPPTGGVWRAREIVFRSVDSDGRSGEYTITAAYGADAPDVGSYGELVAVVVDPDSTDDEEREGCETEQPLQCDYCGNTYSVEGKLKHHIIREHRHESIDAPKGSDRWRELDQKARERGETA